MFDDVETDSFIDLGQRSQVEVLAEQQNQSDTLLRLDRLDKVTEFRGMEAGDMLAKINDIAIRDRGADMHQEIGAYRPVFGVDVRAVVDSDFVGTAVVVAGAAHGPAPPEITAVRARAGNGSSALLAQSSACVHSRDEIGDPPRNIYPSCCKNI